MKGGWETEGEEKGGEKVNGNCIVSQNSTAQRVVGMVIYHQQSLGNDVQY